MPFNAALKKPQQIRFFPLVVIIIDHTNRSIRASPLNLVEAPSCTTSEASKIRQNVESSSARPVSSWIASTSLTKATKNEVATHWTRAILLNQVERPSKGHAQLLFSSAGLWAA